MRFSSSRPAGPRWPAFAVSVSGLVVLLGVVLVLSGFPAWFGIVAGTSGLAMLAALWWADVRTRAAVRDLARQLHEDDPVPCFVGSGLRSLTPVNAAARDICVETVLSTYMAQPESFLDELGTRAATERYAAADRRLSETAIHVTARSLGQGQVLWRLDERRVGQTHDPVPRVALDAEDRVTWASPAVRTLLGFSPERLSDCLDELPVRQFGLHQLAGSGGQRQVILCDRGPDCGGRDVLFLPPMATEGDAAFFERLPVPLLRLTRDGSVRQANRMARTLLEMEAQQDYLLREVVDGPGRPIHDWLDEAFERNGPGRSEVVRAMLAAQELHVQITLGAVEDGEEPTITAVLTDATELKSLEAQFVQSQKMQAIGQLAGGVAHDFNNLLTAISGHCDLLLLRRDPGDPDYPDLEQINQNTNRAASLVGQLLAYSRKQNLRPQLLEVRDTLSDLTHLLNRLVGAQVALTFRHDPDLLMIRADKRQLEQVVMNLVLNARDAMPGGGTISIETQGVTLNKELHRDRAVVAPGRYVVVRVIDDGIGIPADKIGKIFEPFFTTKGVGEGTGLGLSTAYGIIKQTGGYIFADSAEGKGTTFTLYFPAYSRPVDLTPSEPRAEAVRDNARASGTVLLVEDEAPVRAFAARALRMRGLKVIEAANAEDALALLEDAELSVDVFVSDVIMPGIDGPTWVAQALERRPGTRTVFVSGYAAESLSEAQLRIPHSVFLQKPFSLAQLVASVKDRIEDAAWAERETEDA